MTSRFSDAGGSGSYISTSSSSDGPIGGSVSTYHSSGPAGTTFVQPVRRNLISNISF